MKTEEYQISENDRISIPIPESYKDTITLIKSDYYRLFGKELSTFIILFRMIFRPFASAQAWMRVASYNTFMRPVLDILYRLIARVNKIAIPSYTKIGYGFYIGHRMCVVINPATVIGNNVNISQFLSIGSNHGTPAIIGDNVYIGPNVSIVEQVKIGTNSTIGAGAVVTRDIPQNSTAVGSPAKVLNYDNPGRYVGSRWKI